MASHGPESRSERWIAAAAPIVLLLAGVACSTSKAVTLTEVVADRSDQAIEVLRDLKKATQSQTGAHMGVRSALKEASHDLRDLLFERLKVKMDLSLRESKGKVEEAVWDQVLELLVSRDKAREELEQALEDGLQDVIAHWAFLSHDMKEKRKSYEDATGDRDRYDAAIKAEGLYTRFSAKAYELELTLREEAYNALSEAMREAIEKLDLVREEKLRELEATFATALGRIQIPNDELPLGPEPTAPDDIFDSVIEYASAVKDSQGSLKDYILASSINPFRNTLVRGFIKGTVEGVALAVTGKKPSPDWSELKSDYTEFFKGSLDEYTADLKDSQDDAIADVRSASKDALGPALDTIKDKLKGLAKDQGKKLLEAIGL